MLPVPSRVGKCSAGNSSVRLASAISAAFMASSPSRGTPWSRSIPRTRASVASMAAARASLTVMAASAAGMVRAYQGPARRGRMAVMELDTLRKHVDGTGGYTELRWQSQASTRLVMRRGALLQNTSTRGDGVSARCYRDGVFGFAAMPAARPDDGAAALAHVLNEAGDNAERVRGRTRRALGPLPVTPPGTGAHDHRSAQPILSTGALIDLLRRLDAYIRETYPGLVNADLSLVSLATEKALATSAGAASYSYVPRT